MSMLIIRNPSATVQTYDESFHKQSFSERLRLQSNTSFALIKKDIGVKNLSFFLDNLVTWLSSSFMHTGTGRRYYANNGHALVIAR